MNKILSKLITIALALLLSISTVVIIFYLCRSAHNQRMTFRYQWRTKLFLFLIFGFHCFNLAFSIGLIEDYSNINDYQLLAIYFTPILVLMIVNYIKTQSIKLTLVSGYLLTVHFDLNFIVIKYLPDTPMILKLGSKFFYLQNTMLFFMKIYLFFIFIGFSLAEGSFLDAITDYQFYIILADFIVFILQQYYAYFKNEALDITSFNQLTNFIERDQLEINTNCNVKKIFITFIVNQDDPYQIKYLNQVILYYFNGQEIFQQQIQRSRMNASNNSQLIFCLDKQISGQMHLAIQLRKLETLIQAIAINANEYELSELAYQLSQSHNFIYLLPVGYVNENEMLKEYRQATIDIERFIVFTIVYYNHVSNYIYQNPKEILFDIQD